ncbi:class I SAM-dependent methyltransferase [Falsihalocynthiibacter sp. SS001]|uniref:class I SAM-dependent methyltransferase n=1 Tax=Falsihalocynthiibacter sp. SS001 TaxID=3349698 RepID=UPI0036D38AD6
MGDQDKKFDGSIPDIYDEYLVPLIFEGFAQDMASRVAALRPQRVLETAAGSGVVPRTLAPLLAAGAEYHVTDLNPPMLERAKSKQPARENLLWQQADALDLPFQDNSFDVVCCQFGAMFFPNKQQGYSEALRVLNDSGVFIFSVWDDIEENEFADSVTETAGRFFPDDPPLFLRRTPHGFGDTNIIENDLRAVGFSEIDVHTLTKQSHASSGQEPAIAFCQGTPLRGEIEERDATLLEKITKQAATDIEAKFGSGPVSGKIQGHVIVAYK